MKRKSRAVTRRQVLQGTAAAGLAAAATPILFRPAFAVPETVKIGLVGPKTGALALFYKEMSWAIEQARKVTGNQITINGRKHPLEIITKDSESSPNRASEVAQDLILNEKVHIVTAFATPETVNPVSDQCEINGMPCVTNDCPLESYWFGRHGNPKKPFEWTYDFFFTGAGAIAANLAGWAHVPTNREVGVLWANDDDGRTFAQVMPPVFKKAGFKVIDPGRFDLPSSNYTSEITMFKSQNAELCFTVIPGPDFTIFWDQCAQQNYKPKVLQAGKVSEFPQGMYPYGKRALNIMTEVWWYKTYPYSSSLTGQSSMALTEAYEKDEKQQASMALGFRHSLMEMTIGALKRTQKLDDPASIRDALRDNAYKTIVGPVNFKTGPFPNTSETKCTAGQWRPSKKWPMELVIVDNTESPNVPLGGKPEPMHYS